eukprot:11274767-Alexandrium_andersonii.AAC.1
MQLLDSEGKLPPTQETVDAVKALFHTQEAPKQQLPEVPAGRAAFVTRAAVRKAVDRPHAAAQPGPSGFRNTHISFLLRAKRGLGSLHRW